MKAKNLSHLNRLLYFTKESLKQYESNEEALNFNLKYWLKKKIVVRLKNGVYILRDRWDREANKDVYLEFLANKLYEPSYLSCEYVMSLYGLLSEAVYGLSSVTTKKTVSFKNDLGFFSYYSISPKLFLGYEIERFYSTPIFLAKKAKAVFDYLYLRFLKKNPINKKVLEELRINWENIKKSEFQEIEKYARNSGSRRILEVINLTKKIYYA